MTGAEVGSGANVGGGRRKTTGTRGRPKSFCALVAVAIAAWASDAPAEERVGLGWGRLFTNDLLGDGKDRWRSGSYTVSRVIGPAWTGSLPTQFGSVIELRFGGEIIAPSNLADPDKRDRPYAGNVSAGVHTHWAVGEAEVRTGLDLVATGQQTGVASFQEWVHDWSGLGSGEINVNQLPDAIYPTISGEAAQRLVVQDAAYVRPFVELQAGVETFARVGADLLIGPYWADSLAIRDNVSGQLYRGVAGSRMRGVSGIIGADYAYIFDSEYLPSGAGADFKTERVRVRAGAYMQWERVGVFYGATWLSKEFDGQPESQIVGSLRIDIGF
ncbi:MAG: DUF2219 domain-containing protein [Cereibacter sphaeroides]|uniref:DUF2219 domain-containing protein n=1 Tax=Cereibacter sphaeroides TaxID=1063 RepID=A0A2W5TKE8_CERSP|nr:MAG: DUF2219 domain-containing protein [Cereibacter sphaeroides]